MIESADEFRRLRRSTDMAEYRRAAADEAPLDVWHEIIARWPDMRFWVAQNKTVPLEVLELLALDSDANVRHMVASKRKLPPDIQMLLARDRDESVRMALCHNARATRDVLQLLARDPRQKLREAARRRLDDFDAG